MRRAVIASLLVFSCAAVSGCKDSSEDPQPSSSPSTGSPFSASFEGPEVAAPGDRVTATITNTGRLVDRYHFVANPQGGATVTPLEVGLPPGESAEVTIDVITSPVIISVESIGAGGTGIALTQLSIGVQE